MVCKRCGKNIESSVKYCPYCGNAVEHDKSDFKSKGIKKTKNRLVLVVVMVAIILGVFIAAFGWRMSKRKEIHNDIEVIMDELASGDYSSLILSNLQNNHSEEYLELFQQDLLKAKGTSGQFMNTVLNNSQIEYSISLIKDRVKITVTGPDLYSFLSNIKIEKYDNIDDFYADLIKCCMSREKVTHKVWVDVVKSNEHWYLKYDQEFINALLGGSIEGLSVYFQNTIHGLGGK